MRGEPESGSSSLQANAFLGGIKMYHLAKQVVIKIYLSKWEDRTHFNNICFINSK